MWGSWDQTRVISFGGKFLYLLSHLTALYHPHFRDKKTEAHRHNLLETFAKQWQHWL